MKRALSLLLVLVLLRGAAPAQAAAPLAQTRGRHCLRTDTPPPPPDGGVVLERPLDQNSSEPNAVVLPAFAVWIASQLAAFYSVNFTSMSAPNSILSVPFIGRFDPTYPNDGGAS